MPAIIAEASEQDRRTLYENINDDQTYVLKVMKKEIHPDQIKLYHQHQH